MCGMLHHLVPVWLIPALRLPLCIMLHLSTNDRGRKLLQCAANHAADGYLGCLYMHTLLTGAEVAKSLVIEAKSDAQ